MSSNTILEVKNLKVTFDVRSEGDMPWTKAKKPVSYTHLTLPTNREV